MVNVKGLPDKLEGHKIREMRAFKLFIGCLCFSILAAISFAHPASGIAVDRQGNVYFADTGSGPWKIDTNGRLTHLAGPRFHYLILDEDNRFAHTTLPTGASGEIARIGSSPTVLMSSDYPIAIGKDGNLYYPLQDAREIRVMRTLPSGSRSVFATISRTDIAGDEINDMAAGPNGSIYFTLDKSLHRIDSNGNVSMIARDFDLKNSPSIPGVDASAGPYLRGISIDDKGVIFVAATACGRVIRIEPTGARKTLVQTSAPWSPTSIAIYGSSVYSLEYLNTNTDDRSAWLPRVRKIAADGSSSIIASVEKMPGARHSSG